MEARNPTARALLCLEILQDSPGITADRLAERLGVSDRAARRYVSVLREAGLPIESVRGPYGGYRVGRGLRLRPMMFSTVEALGLVMAVLDGHHSASDSTDPVGSALGKLMRALPEQVARQAEAVRRTTAPAPDRAAARPDPETATSLVEACIQHQQVQIGYRSEAGSEWSMTVDPLAVVVRHGRWYLLCWSHRAEARRAYRIDRVTSLEVLDGTFQPPAELDAVAELETHMAFGWEYDIEVIVQAPYAAVARRLPRTLGRLEEIDATATRLIGSTSDPKWYAEQLGILIAPYRIVKGDEVRAATRDMARRLLAAADDPHQPTPSHHH